LDERRRPASEADCLKMNNLTTLYNSLISVPDSLTETPLIEYFPSITQDDISRGFMLRYFARQTNQTTEYITEIDKTEFDSLQSNKFYTTLELVWRITGALDDVAGPSVANSPTRSFTGLKTANQLALLAAEKTLPGIQSRIPNLTQFYQFGK
jgi:hypothetical protein